MKYFALTMSVVYVLAGCMILFTNFLSQEISRFRLPLGLVLVAYGVIRGFMWRQKQARNE